MSAPEREKFFTKVSVGVRLNNNQISQGGGDLVLITKRDSGLLGLIAGHLELNETGFMGIKREMYEESSLLPDSMIFMGQFQEGRDPSPEIVWTFFDKQTSMGLIYDAFMKKPISNEGYIPDNTEIGLVKPYSHCELRVLINKPELWYKPQYNLAVVSAWLRDDDYDGCYDE
jgi:8-oxo-dGTP pyrophosphatase MutT (NUDIX family)